MHTETPWFVSGVRFRMNGSEWHSINRYDEAKKRDENIACVGYDPRTGLGHADAHFIVRAVNSHDALVKALETIRDAFWRDGETCDERIADLKSIARAALAALPQQERS
jgi:hypothetical protein